MRDDRMERKKMNEQLAELRGNLVDRLNKPRYDYSKESDTFEEELSNSDKYRHHFPNGGVSQKKHTV